VVAHAAADRVRVGRVQVLHMRRRGAVLQVRQTARWCKPWARNGAVTWTSRTSGGTTSRRRRPGSRGRV